MNLARLCRIVIFSLMAIIGLFDLYLAAFGSPGDTISLQGFCITGNAWRYKSLTIAIAYMAGHIFGRIDK